MSIRPTSLPRPSAMRLPYGARIDARRFFDPDTDPTDPPAPPTNPNPTDPPGDPADLGDKGKAALDKLRIERRDADRRAKVAEDELATLRAAEQKRKDDEAASQGQFQKLAEDRKVEVDTLTTARDGLQQQVDDLTGRLKVFEDQAEADYQTAVKALPDDLRDLAPADDESIAKRREWLAKAQKSAEKVSKRNERGNPPNPRADGPAGEKDDEEALKAHAAAFRI